MTRQFSPASAGDATLLHLVRSADQKRMPWKNGGGLTTEVAVYPPDASLDDFEWRVSVAHVATDGPFSKFPDIDRTLTVLEGSGLILTVDRDAPVQLTMQSAPFAFAADRAASARLIDGPVIDLNVMSRRTTWRHKVERIDVAEQRTLAPTSTLWVVFCHSGSVQVSTVSDSHRILPRDAVVCFASCADISPQSPSILYCITFHRV